MRKRFPVSAVIALATFLVVILFLLVGLGSVSRSADDQALLATQQAVQRSITQCYALEGSYPPDIAYLEENYGLSYNHEKYTVHYQLTAANLLPQLVILPKP